MVTGTAPRTLNIQLTPSPNTTALGSGEGGGVVLGADCTGINIKYMFKLII